MGVDLLARSLFSATCSILANGLRRAAAAFFVCVLLQLQLGIKKGSLREVKVVINVAGMGQALPSDKDGEGSYWTVNQSRKMEGKKMVKPTLIGI